MRIDPEVYETSPIEDDQVSIRPFVSPVPVHPLFLDLPLLRGDETPFAPYIAASANPWPGSVALYSSQTDQNFGLNTILPIRSTIGVTRSAMTCARPGVTDHGDALEVRLISGRLESVTREALLSGANLAAIGDGSSDNWEVFQFQKAELLAPDTYLLSARLRGQAGSDGLMPEVWPAGSQFVLLNGVPLQIELGRNLRRVAQYYRIGPARRSVDDPSYRELQRAFDGNGLRPYAPAHLRAVRGGDSAINLSWIRRTRTDGDDWEVPEVPLGEETEAYLLRVIHNGVTVHEVALSAPGYVYSAAQQAADGVTGRYEIAVAQISAVYGAGLFGQVEIIS